MVLAYHTIFCAYGFWLPNDPRGSQSSIVRAEHHQPFGPATKIDTCVSIAPASHDFEIRRAVRESLKYPYIEFADEQMAAIAEGFRSVIQTCHIRMWACAILPEHVHLVYARHRMLSEEIIERIKKAAGREMSLRRMHPMEPWRDLMTGRAPSPWAKDEWTVYLNSADDIQRSIDYVRRNPVKSGRPPQQWPFVVPYHRPV